MWLSGLYLNCGTFCTVILELAVAVALHQAGVEFKTGNVAKNWAIDINGFSRKAYNQ